MWLFVFGGVRKTLSSHTVCVMNIVKNVEFVIGRHGIGALRTKRNSEPNPSTERTRSRFGGVCEEGFFFFVRGGKGSVVGKH